MTPGDVRKRAEAIAKEAYLNGLSGHAVDAPAAQYDVIRQTQAIINLVADGIEMAVADVLGSHYIHLVDSPIEQADRDLRQIANQLREGKQ